MKSSDTENISHQSSVLMEVIKDVERILVEKALSHLSALVHSKLDKYIKDVLQTSTNTLAEIIKLLCLVIVGAFIVFFSSIALALWLNGLLGAQASGFLVVAVFYLLFFLVLNRIGAQLIKKYLPEIFVTKNKINTDLIKDNNEQ
jgi:hypothetical protein